jgi:methionyl aminopeptidase
MIYLRSAEEIARIRASAQLVGACLDHLEPLVVPGVATRTLDRAAEEFVRGHGAVPAFKGYRGYPASLCVSVNEVVVHGIPGDDALVEGDIVGLDMGVLRDGFYGDAARTLPVGRVGDDVARLLAVGREALMRGVAAAVDGGRVGDIGHAVQSYVEGFGFNVVRDLTGHGVGRQLHEEPQVPNYGRPGRGPKLQAGMVLAIEPMITAGAWEIFTMPDNWTVITRDRSWSAHFEHTVAVGQGAAEILSLTGRETAPGGGPGGPPSRLAAGEGR